MAGPKENHDPVTGLCELQQIGADQEVSVIPRGRQVSAWLVAA
jgi:hypothetical protein